MPPVSIAPPGNETPFRQEPPEARADRFLSRESAGRIMAKATQHAQRLVDAAEAMLDKSGYLPRSLQAAIDTQLQIARWLRASLGKLPHNHPLARAKVLSPPMVGPVPDFLADCAAQDAPDVPLGNFRGYSVTARTERRTDGTGWTVTLTARKDGSPTVAIQVKTPQRQPPERFVRAFVAMLDEV